MLFAKTEGMCLTLKDWISQCPNEASEESPDLISNAAETLWKAISRAGVPCAAALPVAERKILELAIWENPRTRREIASRLKTSERTLYHKLKSHSVTGHVASSINLHCQDPQSGLQELQFAAGCGGGQDPSDLFRAALHSCSAETAKSSISAAARLSLGRPNLGCLQPVSATS
jgi:hypothetical protein